MGYDPIVRWLIDKVAVLTLKIRVRKENRLHIWFPFSKDLIVAGGSLKLNKHEPGSTFVFAHEANIGCCRDPI